MGIQLVGGRGGNKFEGRVEVCQDGQWKTVCNDGWGDREARVVCRQLGFAEDRRRSELLHKTSIQTLIMIFIAMALSITADRVTNVTRLFGSAEPSQDIVRKRWGCNGSERKLFSCPKDNRSESACGHDRDAGVFCYGKRCVDLLSSANLQLSQRVPTYLGSYACHIRKNL